MTFLEAFRMAVVGKRIRRELWHPLAYLTANDAGYLMAWPDLYHWSGPFNPNIDDVEANDWIAEEIGSPTRRL